METLELLNLRLMARRPYVSQKWLRDEALAGRVPCLRAGSRLLFSAEAVERVLADRAAGKPQGAAHA
jgi:hypothetical protein